MTRKIDIGGRQGRGNPKLGLGEDGTLIDLDSYSEPETTDLQLGPMTRGEYLVKWLLVSLVVCGSIAGAVILATN